ncbi:MAG: hypothetical protein WD077_14255 [Bacteroidia bacterium]
MIKIVIKDEAYDFSFKYQKKQSKAKKEQTFPTTKLDQGRKRLLVKRAGRIIKNLLRILQWLLRAKFTLSMLHQDILPILEGIS